MKLEDIEKHFHQIKHLDFHFLGIFAQKYAEDLLAVAKAAKELPWGESPFLPVCLDSFPELHKAIDELEKE